MRSAYILVHTPRNPVESFLIFSPPGAVAAQSCASSPLKRQLNSLSRIPIRCATESQPHPLVPVLRLLLA